MLFRKEAVRKGLHFRRHGNLLHAYRACNLISKHSTPIRSLNRQSERCTHQPRVSRLSTLPEHLERIPQEIVAQDAAYTSQCQLEGLVSYTQIRKNGLALHAMWRRLNAEVNQPELQHRTQLQVCIAQQLVVVVLLRLMHQVAQCPPVDLRRAAFQ